jgi:RNA polymerase sigma factor (TIGR02999 family)
LADVTELLLQWNDGNEQARASLIRRVYSELKSIAEGHLAAEGYNFELQPHSLVHEAYLRLVNMNRIAWQNRAHFLAMAARIMRQVLVDQARRRRAVKRDGGLQVSLSGLFPALEDPTTDALMLHEALERLANADPERARLVELRFFGGLTIEETAEALGMSPATVKRNWEVARGWLYRSMNSTEVR